MREITKNIVLIRVRPFLEEELAGPKKIRT